MLRTTTTIMHLLLTFTKDHLSNAATISWQIGWPYWRGTTVVVPPLCNPFVWRPLWSYYINWFQSILCVLLDLYFNTTCNRTLHFIPGICGLKVEGPINVLIMLMGSWKCHLIWLVVLKCSIVTQNQTLHILRSYNQGSLKINGCKIEGTYLCNTAKNDFFSVCQSIC